MLSSRGVTNLILLYILNIYCLIFYFRQLHCKCYLISDQLSFNDLTGQIWSFYLFLLCKLTHFYRQVVIVDNVVNVEEIKFVNVIKKLFI